MQQVFIPSAAGPPEARIELKHRPVVLVVEDEPGDAFLIRTQLSERSQDAFVILVADSIEKAVAFLGDAGGPRVDVILLDLNLPDSTGTETVRAVRAHAADLPIVVLTGLDDTDAIAAALQAGAQDYLVKGADGQALRKAIRYAMLRHQRDEDARLAEAVFHVTDTAIAVLDVGGVIRRANPAFEAITGYGEAEVCGKPLDRVTGAGAALFALEPALASVAADGRWEGEIWSSSRDGARHALWLRIHPVRRPDGSVARHIAVFNDITSRKRTEEELAHRATHDHLTGLPNRFLFLDRVERAIEAARRNGTQGGLLYIDLDGFKAVNDTLGHDAGDGVLRGTAQRLADATRASDTAARLAGDEFAVLLNGCPTVDAAARVAHKIVAALAAPFLLPQGRADVSASVGIALFPLHGDDAATVMRAADSAMYTAKKGGKNAFAVFDDGLPAALEVAL